MKVHRYIVYVCESAMDIAHNNKQVQNRLYIPEPYQCVIGYRRSDKIDFFTEEPDALAAAQKIAEGKEKETCHHYFGEIELPDEDIRKMISAGRDLTEAKSRFEKRARSLVDLIQKQRELAISKANRAG